MTAWIQALIATHPFLTGFALGVASAIISIALGVAAGLCISPTRNDDRDVAREGVGAAHGDGDTYVGQ